MDSSYFTTTTRKLLPPAFRFHRCLIVQFRFQVLSLISGPRSFPGGTPVPAMGYPSPAGEGYTSPSRRSILVGGTPCLGLGYPLAWTGVPPSWDLRQYRRASTCYAASGTPLAVTQEDFLVCCQITFCRQV